MNKKTEGNKKIFDLDVILDFIFDDGFFFISVKNIGEYPVFKVSVEFNKKFSGLGGRKEISSLPLFRNIEFLAPQKEINTFLDSSYSYFNRKQPEKLNAKIAYTDKEGKIKTGIIKHDLLIYKEIGYIKKIKDEIHNRTGDEQ